MVEDGIKIGETSNIERPTSIDGRRGASGGGGRWDGMPGPGGRTPNRPYRANAIGMTSLPLAGTLKRHECRAPLALNADDGVVGGQ